MTETKRNGREAAGLAEAEKGPAPEELSNGDALKLDLYFWLQALVMALVSLIVVFTLVGRIIGVEGSSMLPTLHHGDLLLLQSIGYTPKNGDVVVLTKEFDRVTEPIVKRVIAVGGQQVEIDYAAGTVRVDGRVLDEPYLGEAMRAPHYGGLTSVAVPEGSIFVMGDNRNHSNDSRDVTLGTVDTRYVLGKVELVFFPFSRFGRPD